jgi:catechol 2,3-dioxygenase-like lactoylglutathione lyase family enzyme
MRPQPLISVTDVPRSSRWYQNLLACESDHRGQEYERLVHDGTLMLQLHHFAVEHLHGRIGDPDLRPYGNGVALCFEIDDFDAAVHRAEALNAEIALAPHRNPLEGPGGPAHREIWLRGSDGYLVVLASPDGESPWPDPRFA